MVGFRQFSFLLFLMFCRVVKFAYDPLFSPVDLMGLVQHSEAVSFLCTVDAQCSFDVVQFRFANCRTT